MPFYHALVRPDLMSEPQRRRFAGDVVNIHCDVTGAPPSFVHVLITDDQNGDLPVDRVALVKGTIRAGRSTDQKAEIATRISAAIAATAGVLAKTVHTSTSDIQASFTMEGGVLLPEPGSPEERAWMTG